MSQNTDTVNRLREWRKSRRLTIYEVAAALVFHLNKSIDPTLISKHETGERNVTPEFITAYAKLYKTETHELFLKLDE